jgi:phosphoribosyl 1,2-cyclic phosphodiesterase
VKVGIWGARGSIPAPGPETMRYGGNTSCLHLTLDDGSQLVLDAGTGIRGLGLAMRPSDKPIHILLTHLHLDHIQGLMFFAPLFWPESEIVIWGPASAEGSLEERIARYISAPLAPIDVRELPCHPSFRESPTAEWQIGSAHIQAASVTHRGPTLGYRIECDGASLCYIPDHEPGLGTPIADLEPDWLSGFGLACDATLLVHDCQYADDEYPRHVGWGHSPLEDALLFGDRSGVERLLLFHHDPLHSDDYLDSFAEAAAARWQELGGERGKIDLARERGEIELRADPVTAGA